jgi:hypothetical protein
MDAARFVVERPEMQRTIQWEDPFSDEPEEDPGPQQEEDLPGIDLDWTRQWVESHPLIKDEERGIIFAAMDAFASLKRRKVLTRKHLEPIVEAIRCRWQAARNVGGELLAELAWTQPAAQGAFRELLASRKARDRLWAILSLSRRMPAKLILDLLTSAVDDRSKQVRRWAAQESNSLNVKEMIPKLMQRLEVESDADVKRELLYNATMLKDGYLIDRSEGGIIWLNVRIPGGGVTGQMITQRDIDRGRVPAFVAKTLAERQW